MTVASDTAAREAWFFLHIPKTAGTSLRHLLRCSFPSGTVCPAWHWQGLIQIADRDLEGYHGFAGHFEFSLPEYLARPVRVFTFLRDPLEHALSAYAHILRDPAHRLHATARTQGCLRNFLREPHTRRILANAQTRWLARDVDAGRFRLHRDPEQVEREVRRAIVHTEDENECAEDGLLCRALERLGRMAFVGFVERYEESLRGLFATLGRRLEVAVPALNAGSNRLARGSLGTEERRILDRELGLDFALYERARALWAHRRPAV